MSKGYVGKHLQKKQGHALRNVLIVIIVIVAAVAVYFGYQYSQGHSIAETIQITKSYFTGENGGQNSSESSLTSSVSGTSSSQSSQSSGSAISSASSFDYSTINLDLASDYMVIVNMDTDTVLGGKDENVQMYPASMTKVLTLLVCCENITDWNDTCALTQEAADKCYTNDGSVAGFAVDEQVPLKDVLYGLILPSGADAAYMLADYVGGSEEGFVEMMNEWCTDHGITTAHFTNPVGFHSEDHYCTALDMERIFAAALENEVAYQVLTTSVYTTQPTDAHPDGITLSSWFLSSIPDYDTGTATVLAVKTGYTEVALNCAVSYAVGEDGTRYICVTAHADGAGNTIADHALIYKNYVL